MPPKPRNQTTNLVDIGTLLDAYEQIIARVNSRLLP
jgi:hypothetical protein